MTGSLRSPVADQRVAIVSVDPTNYRATAATREQSLIQIDIRYHVGAIHVVPVVGDQWIVRRFGQNWALQSQLPANTTELLGVADTPIQGLTQVGSTNPNSAGPLHLNGSQVVVNAPLGLSSVSSAPPATAPEGSIAYDNVLQAPIFFDGTSWNPVGSSAGGGTSDPTKVTANASITPGTHTKITYDSKGLVTAGVDAGVSDITGLPTALSGKLDKPTAITAATHTKITYDANGLVTGGTDIAIADVGGLSAALTTLTSAAATGTTFRAYRSITSTWMTGGGAAPGQMNMVFFDHLQYKSSDIDWDGIQLTLHTEGTYLINIRYHDNSTMRSNTFNFPAIFKNPSLTLPTATALMGQDLVGSTLLYCNAGDVLVPGIQTAVVLPLVGDAAGIKTYFEVTKVSGVRT